MILGAITGDSVGSRFEFNNIRTRIFCPFIKGVTDFTDDSVMTVAVMDICNSGDFSPENVTRTLQKWAREYPGRGYGGRFMAWIMSDSPQPYDSCGNGSAMRVSPIGWYAGSEEEVKRLSKAVTEVTHNHPEGIKGAEVTAMMVYKARNGASMEELIEYAVGEYPEILEMDYESLRRNYRFTELAQETVPQAVFCFIISRSFEDCLRTTISIGGDCDTTAAISCAIAEAYYGRVTKGLFRKARGLLDRKMTKTVESFDRTVSKRSGKHGKRIQEGRNRGHDKA